MSGNRQNQGVHDIVCSQDLGNRPQEGVGERGGGWFEDFSSEFPNIPHIRVGMGDPNLVDTNFVDTSISLSERRQELCMENVI